MPFTGLKVQNFSERNGVRSAAHQLSHTFIDDQAREELWAVLFVSLFNPMKPLLGHWWFRTKIAEEFVLSARRGIGVRLDSFPEHWETILNEFRHEMFRREWWGVYDFLEVMLRNAPNTRWLPLQDRLRSALDESLQTLGGHFSVVGTEIVPRISPNEVAAINLAISSDQAAWNKHLERAISLYKQRPNGDFRNSVKESLSAVEAIVRSFAGDETGNLGELCNQLKGKKELNTNLATSLSQLYWYASGFGGARHALKPSQIEAGQEIVLEDARLILVCCAGWVNYFSARMRSREPQS
jgi:hypothetical protein